MINHGHIAVNGRKVDVASFLAKPGDAVSAGKKEKTKKLVKANLEITKGRGRPSWLEFDEGSMSGKVLSKPTRDEVSIPIQEQLIIELMSK
jgi:small subunit ribosomal protein S4